MELKSISLMQLAVLGPSFFLVCNEIVTSASSQCSEVFYQTRLLCNGPRGIAPVLPLALLKHEIRLPRIFLC